MPTLCLDASVLLAALLAKEPTHAEARDLIERAVVDADVDFIEPSLLPIECGAALARRGAGPSEISEILDPVLAALSAKVDAVDEAFAIGARKVAQDARLRGADACYLETARRAGAWLVTLDTEVLARGGGAAPCLAPGAAAKRLRPR